jgi:hypothetical protein
MIDRDRRVVPRLLGVVASTAISLAACATTARAHDPAPAPAGSPPSSGAPADEDHERRDQPVTDADLRILGRADQILASPAVWNRHDTRDCRPTDTTWSLFCALHQACVEVLGEYHHRAPALQEVRFVVEEVTQRIDLQHRLMDYNNLASTRFENIKHVLAVATDRVRARLAAQQHR